MKKFIGFVLGLLMVVMTSTALAADAPKDFNRENKYVETFVQSFTDSTVTYSNIATGIAPELKAKFSEKEFAALHKLIEQKFGRNKELKFISFEQFDKADRVIYMGSFSKEKMVLMTFTFDNTGSKPLLNGMNMVPLEAKADGTIVVKKAE